MYSIPASNLHGSAFLADLLQGSSETPFVEVVWIP